MYKNKYNEALKKAKEYHKRLLAESYNDYYAEELEHLFPELTESEDEKIRNAILAYIGSKQDIDLNTHNKWCSWLEKQAEQKPVEIVNWSPQEVSCICQLESLVKEQWRHAEKVNNAVDIKKMQELIFFLKTLNPNKKPQRMISAEAKEALYSRPPLSEFENALADICRGWIGEEIGWEDYISTNADALLKIAFKKWNDVQCVKKSTEWSEEDERICQCIICDQEKALDDVRNDKYGHSEIISDLKETYRERINWLESLKERIGG